jgi:hypothetical protein
MLWVWVIPLAILCYAVIAFEPKWKSVLVHESWLPHYFGWGCLPTDHCLDQLVITMPFYAAAAYSIGAWFALKHPKQALLSKSKEKITGKKDAVKRIEQKLTEQER